MKTFIRQMTFTLFLGIFSLSVGADTTYSNREEVDFPKPSKPGLLRIISGEGDIIVEGYDGQGVIIEANSSIKNAQNPPEDEKAKGMKRISGFGLSISSSEEENAVVITRSMRDTSDLFIRVPFSTSLQFGGGAARPAARVAPPVPPDGQLDPMAPDSYIDMVFENIGGILENVISSFGPFGGMSGGDITISNVSGEIEVNTREGDITLNHISGEVVAHSIDGDLLIVFKKLTKKEPMAFSTIDGDIDVTFPADTQATISAKNVDGEIYTDFDMDIIHVKEIDADRNRGWRNGLTGMFGNTVTGKINGGGADILISTVDGNIYIRKGK
ncbi:MAG: DUF4097 family beta strand repeat protein [Deltaproteobacteria bacterium]|nr:DUF4097 family beta strand repeat protein [Deltaproteobacteria bacterium]